MVSVLKGKDPADEQPKDMANGIMSDDGVGVGVECDNCSAGLCNVHP